MHGLIFTAFRVFAATEYPAVVDAAWAAEPSYLATAAYEDEQFDALVERVAGLAADSRRTVLRRFGIFAGLSTFRLMFPDYYAAHGGTAAFLLEVEEQIHDVVRTTIPGAAPPRLVVRPLGREGVSISYTSERGLCDLLEGLVVGVSRFYGEVVRIDHPLCMHQGDAACSFFVERM